MREERKPGTISVSRVRLEWQAEEHAFQPKWCSSSPTFGIGVRWTIWRRCRTRGFTSTTARKSGSSIPVPS